MQLTIWIYITCYVLNPDDLTERQFELLDICDQLLPYRISSEYRIEDTSWRGAMCKWLERCAHQGLLKYAEVWDIKDALRRHNRL